MADKLSDDIIRAVAAKVAREMIESSNDMQQYMLVEIIDALEHGEDVEDSLVNIMLTRPFMSRFIDELLKYEEE